MDLPLKPRCEATPSAEFRAKVVQRRLPPGFGGPTAEQAEAVRQEIISRGGLIPTNAVLAGIKTL